MTKAELRRIRQMLANITRLCANVADGARTSDRLANEIASLAIAVSHALPGRGDGGNGDGGGNGRGRGGTA